jgi:two-component system chemotaxis sensor kinase CheA
VAFTHVVESVLDRVRDGHLSVADGLLSALLVLRPHRPDDGTAGQQRATPADRPGEPLAQLRDYLSPGGARRRLGDGHASAGPEAQPAGHEH